MTRQPRSGPPTPTPTLTPTLPPPPTLPLPLPLPLPPPLTLTLTRSCGSWGSHDSGRRARARRLLCKARARAARWPRHARACMRRVQGPVVFSSNYYYYCNY